MDSEILRESYHRLARTGPEFGGDNPLANHGPMAVEVLVRRGYGADAPRWLDSYVRRREELPRESEPVTEQSWPAALGVRRRVGDWTAYFGRALGEAPWREVLATWWPRLVTAGTLRYLTHGHGSPVLLVHVATAPNAVLHTLPALPEALWLPSLAAVWSASAAITAAYAPAQPTPPGALPSARTGPGAAADAVDRAVRHRDEHVIKFTDTAVEVCQRTDDPRALAAAARAARLISPSRPARP